MSSGERASDFEATVRRAFQRLTRHELPRGRKGTWLAGAGRPPGFERLLLDHVSDTPRPAGGASPPSVVDLVLAVELGERAACPAISAARR